MINYPVATSEINDKLCVGLVVPLETYKRSHVYNYMLLLRRNLQIML